MRPPQLTCLGAVAVAPLPIWEEVLRHLGGFRKRADPLHPASLCFDRIEAAVQHEEARGHQLTAVQFDWELAYGILRPMLADNFAGRIQWAPLIGDDPFASHT